MPCILHLGASYRSLSCGTQTGMDSASLLCLKNSTDVIM